MRAGPRIIELAQLGESYRDWYSQARQEIEHVTHALGWNTTRFIDILALTSPRVHVKKNLNVTVHYLRTGEFPHKLIPSVEAAVQHYEQTGEIRGPKTSAFARALKGDLDAVVLDVWMAAAFEVDPHKFSLSSVRSECTSRIVKASIKLGWKPAETQAAVWASTMRLHRRSVSRFRADSILTLFD